MTKEFKEMKVQYIANKEIYEKAIKEENWDLAESVEDYFLEAERELVQWGLDQAVAQGKFTRKEADQLIVDMSIKQYKAMAEMTSRVAL